MLIHFECSYCFASLSFVNGPDSLNYFNETKKKKPIEMGRA